MINTINLATKNLDSFNENSLFFSSGRALPAQDQPAPVQEPPQPLDQPVLQAVEQARPQVQLAPRLLPSSCRLEARRPEQMPPATWDTLCTRGERRRSSVTPSSDTHSHILVRILMENFKFCFDNELKLVTYSSLCFYF